jgi:hypothetical protein
MQFQLLPFPHKEVVVEMEVVVIAEAFSQMEILEYLEVDQHNLQQQVVVAEAVDGHGLLTSHQLMVELEVR